MLEALANIAKHPIYGSGYSLDTRGANFHVSRFFNHYAVLAVSICKRIFTSGEILSVDKPSE